MSINKNSFGVWNLFDAPITDSNIICYGNGRFVAISSTKIMSSTDGRNWTFVNNTPVSAAWVSVCYGNGKFVVISANNNVTMYSTDGITWTQGGNAPVSVYWYRVCYGNGKFVAIATNDNKTMYSTDGITWTQGGNAPYSIWWLSVCYGNGKFVAVADGGTIMYSSDGITWTKSGNAPVITGWRAVCYGNGKFVAIAGYTDNNKTMYSTDGITWTQGGNIPTSSQWEYICYGDGIFSVVSRNNGSIVATSYDGITWKTRNCGADTSLVWKGLCYGEGIFATVSTSKILVFPASYLSIYDGLTIDDIIEKIINFDQSVYSWKVIASSPSQVIDLDTLKDSGNYIIEYYSNGVPNLTIKPVNLIVNITDSKITQWIYFGNIEYIRTYDGTLSKFSSWGQNSTSTPIYSGTTAPNPSEYKVWLDLTTPTLPKYKIYIGTKWVEYISGGYLTNTVYDSLNRGTNPFSYVDVAKTNSLGTADSKLNQHKANNVNHLSPEERVVYDGKMSPADFDTLKTATTTELHTDSDTKLTKTTIGLTTAETNETTSEGNLSTHAQGTVAHLTAAERTTFDSKPSASHTHFSDGNVQLDAADIVSGIISVDRFPDEVFDRVYTCQTEANRLALTKASIQNGDSVHVIANDYWYKVVDDTKLGTESAFLPYKSDENTIVDWVNVTNKPTNVSGYNVTNLNTKTADDASTQTMNTNIHTNADTSIANMDAGMTSYGKFNFIVDDSKDMPAFQGMCYANDKNIMVIAGMNIRYSNDGIHWTEVIRNISTNSLITYVNGIYYTPVGSRTMSSSKNLTHWTSVGDGTKTNYFQVCSSADTILYMTSTDCLLVCYKITTGTFVSLSPSVRADSICWAADRFFITDGYNVKYSFDGVEWFTSTTLPSSCSTWIIGYGNGRLIAVGKSTQDSRYSIDNGVTWTIGGNTSLPVSATVKSIIYGDGVFYISGNGVNEGVNYYIIMSKDAGVTWIRELVPGGNTVVASTGNSAIFANGKLIFRSMWNTVGVYTPNPELPTGTIRSILEHQMDGIISSMNGIQPYVKDIVLNTFSYNIKTIPNIYPPNLISVCYGNDKFVAIAYDSNVIMYSYDGITWIQSGNAPVGAGWRSVCYGNGKFVAVASNNTVTMYSTDGITWTQGGNAPVSTTWQSVCYGNGKFVAITNNNNATMYSTDGITWTQGGNAPVTATWQSVCYGNGKFVAITNNNNKTIYSTDGITWTQGGDAPLSGDRVCYGNGKFVAISYGSNVTMYSTDGITWTQGGNAPVVANWRDICYGNGKFVAIPYGNNLTMYSADGITWTQGGNIPFNIGWNSVCYGNGKFVAISTSSSTVITMYSIDSIEWVISMYPFKNNWLCVASNENIAVAVCGFGYIYYSVDGGINWEFTTPPLQEYWATVCYGNGKFVAVANTVTMYSTDGITWTQGGNAPASVKWYSVCYGNGKFVAISYNSDKTMYSTDGITWTQGGNAPAAIRWKSVCYGNGKFVAVTGTSSAMYSTDGINWTAFSIKSSRSETMTILSVSFHKQSGLFVALCRYYTDKYISYIYTSMGNDFSTWTEVNSFSNGTNAVQYQNIICGDNHVVIDGIKSPYTFIIASGDISLASSWQLCKVPLPLLYTETTPSGIFFYIKNQFIRLWDYGGTELRISDTLNNSIKLNPDMNDYARTNIKSLQGTITTTKSKLGV